VISYKYARPEVDVWAIAACLYALLTGSPPRDFPTWQDPWQVVLQSDLVPIRQRLPDAPPRLADLLDAALMDRDGLCFKSAREFKGQLEQAL
jgi:serine/threonine protein kinase